MIIKEDLTYDQKVQGRRHLLLFSFFNGVSHICITGNILVLFLLKSGCKSYIAIVISSLFYIGSIAVIFSKFFISKWGSASTMSVTLFFRGISALLLASTPFILLHTNDKNIIMILLLLFSLMYFIFRSIGAPAMRPLFGDLTDNENKGKYTSSYFLYYNIAMLIFIVVSFFLLRHNKRLIMFQLIIGIGAVTNFISCFLLSRVKETETAELSSRSIDVASIYKKFWLNKPVRTFFIARGCSIAICAIIVQVSIITLKDIYNVTDSFALIFTIIQLVGSIALTYINKIISEYTGPKPLMIIYVFCLMLISALWVFSPVKLNIYHAAVIFFLGGISISGITASSFHYFLLITPPENTVGYSLMFSIITGLIAGLAGIIIGGGLIKLLSLITANHYLMYKYFYFIMLLLCIPVVYMLTILKSFTDCSVSKVLGLLLSAKDMSTLYYVNKIEKYESVNTEYKTAERLIYSRTKISEQAIIYYLKSPNSLIRLKALKALFNVKISKKFYPALLKELETGEHSTGFYVAHIAGINKMHKAIPLLRKYLYSRDNMLKSYSMVALAQLEDKDSYKTIENIFKETEIPMILLKGAIAMSMFDTEDYVEIALKKLVTVECPCIIQCEILYYVAKAIGIGDDFYIFLRHYNEKQQDGVYWIVNLLKKNKKLKDAYKMVERFYHNDELKLETIDYLYNNLAQYKIEAKELIDVIEHTHETKIANEIIYLMFILLNKINR
ncbi:MAG TPA: MFS transporter [Victivallales bacterium]|nr:MFS transporter [Victivallales bacterium]